MSVVHQATQFFNSPEEFEAWLAKLGVDPSDLQEVEAENRLDENKVVGEYNANFPPTCPYCKAPVPEHQMIIDRGLVIPCPLAPTV